eukprot:TRINITY_DN57933_c0_g1_i1.p1 TRINITY_DN57933_c0_g1~~TRINITY_DN57933_c0_g1_i1.p1  ORF type:complete len:633 (-),score=173.98 TRINITY_DN57933_c0_g1_i1:264-2162(-)
MSFGVGGSPPLMRRWSTVSLPATHHSQKERLGLSRSVRANEAVDFSDPELQKIVVEKSSYEDKVKAFEMKTKQTHMQQITGGHRNRIFVSNFLEGVPYQLFIAVVTLWSCITVVLETDYRASHEDDLEGAWFGFFSDILVGIYTIDVLARLYVFRSHFFFHLPNVVDSFVLAVDVLLEFWVGLPNIFAALKAIRFVRLARVLRGASEFRELYLIMTGIISSIRALMFGSMLVFMMLTVFSILAVHFVRPVHRELHALGVYGDCTVCEEAFDSVMLANLTIMSTTIAGDSWGRLAIPLCMRSPTAAMVIIGSFIVINLGLLNTIAAVIVDRQAQARQNDVDYMLMLQSEEVRESYSYLQEIFAALDADGNGTTELHELMDFYDSDEEFKNILNRMDIHKSDLPIVFDIIDTDNSGDVKFSEFVSGLHSLKHENSHTLQVFTKHFAERLYEKWFDVEEIKGMVRQLHCKTQEMHWLVLQQKSQLEEADGSEAAGQDGETEAEHGHRRFSLMSNLSYGSSNAGRSEASGGAKKLPQRGRPEEKSFSPAGFSPIAGTPVECLTTPGRQTSGGSAASKTTEVRDKEEEVWAQLNIELEKNFKELKRIPKSPPNGIRPTNGKAEEFVGHCLPQPAAPG